jgi:hypothetical protein
MNLWSGGRHGLSCDRGGRRGWLGRWSRGFGLREDAFPPSQTAPASTGINIE